MAEITAALVKELRERTGIGMMECKKALVETNGDIEVAIDNLRKSGQAKAAKKAGRVAAQGAVVTACTAGYGVMVEVNSETDFAAREESFLAFTEQLAAAVLKARTTDLDAIMQLPLNGGTVEEARQALVQKIGENIQVRRAADMSATGVVASYVHTGKIGVLVGLTGGTEDLAKDVAMHVAASNPMVTTSDQVRPEVLEKEKEIIRAQPDMQGKPAEIVEKMVGGRISKFLKEVSLVDQPFVKNPDQTVAQLVKAAGADVMGFVRFEVGEGIEIVEVDFAAEVAAQVQGRA